MKVNINGIWYDAEKMPIHIHLSKSDKNNIANMQEDKFNYVCFPDGMKWDEVEKKLYLSKPIVCESCLECKGNDDIYHDWFYYSVIKPPVGIEVLAQTDQWVSEDYNKKGIRVGFQNGNHEGEFVTAKWDNCGDTYENCEEHKPNRWKFFSRV